MHKYLISFTATLPRGGQFVGDVSLSFPMPLAVEDMGGVKDTITKAMTIETNRPTITSIWKFER